MDLTTKAGRQEAVRYAQRLLNAGRLDEAEALTDRLYAATNRVRPSRQGAATKAATLAEQVAATLPDYGAPAWALGMSAADRELVEYLRTGATKATQIEAQGSLGGFLVPAQMAERVMGRVLQRAVVRPRATVEYFSTATGYAPIVTGGTDQYTSGLRAEWLNELQTQNSGQALTLGAARVPTFVQKVKIPLSKSFAEDAPALLLATLERYAGDAFASAEDRACLIGTGVDEPLGILAQSTPGTLINSDVRVTATGAPGALTADALVRAFYALPAVFRDAPGFVWTMNSTTAETVRVLKDGSGRYVFDQASGTLLGKPVAESEHMPDIATSAFPVLCGDFSAYQISDRTGIGVERYNDSTLAAEDKLRFDFRRRLGGQPVLGYAFSAVKVS